MISPSRSQKRPKLQRRSTSKKFDLGICPALLPLWCFQGLAEADCQLLTIPSTPRACCWAALMDEISPILPSSTAAAGERVPAPKQEFCLTFPGPKQGEVAGLCGPGEEQLTQSPFSAPSWSDRLMQVHVCLSTPAVQSKCSPDFGRC